MNKHLCWEPQYAFEKIFTLTTRWQLLHLPNFTLETRLSIPDLFIPDEIKKIRNIKSTASYEIIWKKEHNMIEMLKEYRRQTQENDDDNIDDGLLTSIEPQNLVLHCYPQLVETFENTRNVKAKKRTANSRAKKKVTTMAEGNAEIKNTKQSRQKKTRKGNTDDKSNKKIDEFISNNCLTSLDDSFEKMTITPKRSKQTNALNKTTNMSENGMPVNVKQAKRGLQFKRILETEKISSKVNTTIDKILNELSPDDFTNENEDDLNITEVIEGICSKRIFQFSSENCEPIKSVDQLMENVTKECRSTDKLEPSTSNVEKIIYVEDDNEESSSVDEFDNINESYIPINQRIQENKKQMCNQIEKKSCFMFEDIMNETDENSLYI